MNQRAESPPIQCRKCKSIKYQGKWLQEDTTEHKNILKEITPRRGSYCPDCYTTSITRIREERGLPTPLAHPTTSD